MTFFALAAAALIAAPVAVPEEAPTIRIAVAHLAPTPRDFDGNAALIERAVRQAATQGANWVITPELAESGYEFARTYPVRRLPQFPDRYVSRLAQVTRESGVTLFLGLPQHRGTRLRNAVVAIDQGRVVGMHAKVTQL